MMYASGSRRKLTLIELNEFDPEFLRHAASKLGLPRIAEALSLRHSQTITDDRVEHHGLDPWVQWVNVHCGHPSAKHGILHLAQTQRQKMPQLWTRLGETGCTWGVWGAMNAPRQTTEGCKFFFPDPWSFEEEAYPANLNKLLALPRYMAKNYLDADRVEILRNGIRFATALTAPGLWSVSAKFTATMLTQVAKSGVSIHTFSTFLDYLSAMVVTSLRRRHRPDFTLIFLNNIAHLQHQFWTRGDNFHPEMEIGLRLTDRMLGMLMDDLDDDEALIVMNGLKQKNVDGEGFCVYRQKNPQDLLHRLGLPGRVEQCMTHDAHIICQSPAEADEVERYFKSCKLSNGSTPFYVERTGDARVFYQIEFEHEVSPDETLVFGNTVIKASEVLELYAKRTGAHIPFADVFAKGITLPERLYNHEVNHAILNYFDIAAAVAADAAPHQLRA